jgi:hypothetical protein
MIKNLGKSMVFAGALFCASSGAIASSSSYSSNPWYWLGPAMVGGVIGYQLGRPTYVPPPQIQYVYPVAPPFQTYHYEIAPYGYQYVYVYDVTCNCYRQNMIPIR